VFRAVSQQVLDAVLHLRFVRNHRVHVRTLSYLKPDRGAWPLSWLIGVSLATSSLVFVLTYKVWVSFAVGGLEFVINIGLSWFHERMWGQTRFGNEERAPAVLWFTGLPSSGKTTLSSWVVDRLHAQGVRVEHLDGDIIRHVFPDTGFSRAERDAHIKRVGYLASKLEQNGVFVVASFVSPYEESRQFVRRLCSNFIEIYVATPLDICQQRDGKGIYAKARCGEIQTFTGITAPYEPPSRPELVIDTTRLTVEQAGLLVLELLRERLASVG